MAVRKKKSARDARSKKEVAPPVPYAKCIEKLRKGVREWNTWRGENPDPADLSGLDLSDDRKTREAILESPWHRVVLGINMKNTLLKKAKLERLTFHKADFRGATLDEASLNGSTFERGEFAATVEDIEQRREESGGSLQPQDEEFFRNQACSLKKTSAFGTTLRRFSLSYADLTTMKVDEGTMFDRVGVLKTRITRAKLERLRDYGGLSAGRRAGMDIIDDIATLRQSFSGFWNAIHVLALIGFVFPYVWFLVGQWVLARVGESIPSEAATSTILENVLRFIVSGGESWRVLDIRLGPTCLFFLALVFNLARGALFAKTKLLEHRQSVTGLYGEFRLVGFWKWALDQYRLLGVLAITLLLMHAGMFLLKPVPL